MSPPSLLFERVVCGDYPMAPSFCVQWHPQGVNHVASSVVSNRPYDTASSAEVVPRFEPFERCCMAILFVGGRWKTTPHPTSPPSLLFERVVCGDYPVAPSFCFQWHPTGVNHVALSVVSNPRHPLLKSSPDLSHLNAAAWQYFLWEADGRRHPTQQAHRHCSLIELSVVITPWLPPFVFNGAKFMIFIRRG